MNELDSAGYTRLAFCSHQTTPFYSPRFVKQKGSVQTMEKEHIVACTWVYAINLLSFLYQKQKPQFCFKFNHDFPRLIYFLKISLD